MTSHPKSQPYDVIKMSKMRGEVGKRWIIPHFYDVTDTLSSYVIDVLIYVQGSKKSGTKKKGDVELDMKDEFYASVSGKHKVSYWYPKFSCLLILKHKVL